MRVTKNAAGDFVVEDEPMFLEGSAADQFLGAMQLRDEVGNDTARRTFLAECDRAYEMSVAKRSAR